MKIAILIPARYNSSRLPGKPLVLIHKKTMLERVVTLSLKAAENFKDISVIVATDDDRIADHCKKININFCMTDPKLPSGSDRIAETLKILKIKPDFIINMQGDAPFTPPEFLEKIIQSFIDSPCDVITPVTQLSWEELDKLREQKLITPLSGTTVVFNPENYEAYWFSKNIIPAIRDENKLRSQNTLSPVYRHIGLYGYSRKMLEKYITLPESYFEKLEGLEQLRILENNYKIRCVPVEYNNPLNMAGIDSPEDVARAEKLIQQYGEML